MHKLRAFLGGTGKCRGRNGVGVGDTRVLLRDRAEVARSLAGKVRSFRYGCQ
jgi:hypothetical protein